MSGRVSKYSYTGKRKLADLNTVLKETTSETNETVQELKSDLAGVKKQLGDQQRMLTAMYRHGVSSHSQPVAFGYDISIGQASHRP